ncbi:MAG: type II secretion system F family protein [Pseudomonadota bacterium]
MPSDLINLAMALALGIGLFTIQALCLPAIGYVWGQLSETNQNRISDVLKFTLGPDAKPVDTLALMIFCCLLISTTLAFLGGTIPAILMINALFLALPIFFYMRASGQRMRELELALPLALQQVANEMAAGATLETALKKVAKSAPPPADIEIGRLQRRVEIMGIDEAFGEMAKELDMQSFTLTASVVRVGTSSGGRLIEALKNLSRTLIEIERLNKKLRTASENGRRNLYLMSFVGPLVAVASSLVVDHETSVLEDGFGQLLVMIAVLSFVGAHVIGHFLTKVKV